MIALILRRWPIIRFVIGGVTLTAVTRFAAREIPRGPVVLGLIALLAILCFLFAFCFSWPWLPRLVGMRDPKQRYIRFLLVCGFLGFSVGVLDLFNPPTFGDSGSLTGIAGLIFGSVTYLHRLYDSNKVA